MDGHNPRSCGQRGSSSPSVTSRQLFDSNPVQNGNKINGQESEPVPHQETFTKPKGEEANLKTMENCLSEY